MAGEPLQEASTHDISAQSTNLPEGMAEKEEKIAETTPPPEKIKPAESSSEETATLPKNNSEAKKVAYLTFDDGPSEITPMVLDILKQHNIKATFFVIGNRVEAYPELVKRIVSEGHLVGNHTYSHKYKYIYSSPESFFEDLYHAEEVLNNTIGIKPKVIRAPGGTRGNFSEALAKKLLEQGYLIHDWNVDSKDSSAPVVSADRIRGQVSRQTANKNSVVILFHDGAGKNTLPVALPSIIEDLKVQGFVFKSLDEIPHPIIAMYQ
ncbi:polysaccharide deacetylase family protein [Heliobacillus mobilis]|uniref:Polysaccharide deacetylase family protein n=1 Tax=Heliobacterium mobile TaxID=28064 RepID=A0A6I3SMR5_HELMO|nr:polysaccharide deacetylase family protein [Heliobacterium mobile]MTV50270.1 polysaccharide deacetylase family protein [Heliobacterium mobile]